MNTITYYWKKPLSKEGKPEIIARCYQASDGWKFEIGKAFNERDPVSTLRKFFTTSYIYCKSKSEVKREVNSLKKKYPCTEIYSTEENYR